MDELLSQVSFYQIKCNMEAVHYMVFLFYLLVEKDAHYQVFVIAGSGTLCTGG
jgi:hypothetical protein